MRLLTLNYLHFLQARVRSRNIYGLSFYSPTLSFHTFDNPAKTHNNNNGNDGSDIYPQSDNQQQQQQQQQQSKRRRHEQQLLSSLNQHKFHEADLARELHEVTNEAEEDRDLYVKATSLPPARQREIEREEEKRLGIADASSEPLSTKKNQGNSETKFPVQKVMRLNLGVYLLVLG